MRATLHDEQDSPVRTYRVVLILQRNPNMQHEVLEEQVGFAFSFPPECARGMRCLQLVTCTVQRAGAASEVPSRPPQRAVPKASSLSLRPIRPMALLDADSMLSLCTCASRAPHLVVEVVRPDARRIVRPVRHRGVGSGRTDVNALVEEQVRAAQYSRRTCRVVA